VILFVLFVSWNGDYGCMELCSVRDDGGVLDVEGVGGVGRVE